MREALMVGLYFLVVISLVGCYFFAFGELARELWRERLRVKELKLTVFTKRMLMAAPAAVPGAISSFMLWHDGFLWFYCGVIVPAGIFFALLGMGYFLIQIKKEFISEWRKREVSHCVCIVFFGALFLLTISPPFSFLIATTGNGWLGALVVVSWFTGSMEFFAGLFIYGIVMPSKIQTRPSQIQSPLPPWMSDY